MKIYYEGDRGGGGIEEHIVSDGDTPVEIPPEQWKLENEIHKSKEWDKNPEKAYGDIVENVVGGGTDT